MVDNFKGDEEEVNFDLVEDIEYPSFIDHDFQVNDIDESIREPLRAKNILESFDTCFISNETCKIDNLKVGGEEVELNLSEDTKCHSFMDFYFSNFYF